MKKVAILSLLASLCMVSCGGDSKKSNFDYSKPATEAQVSEIVKNVQDKAAEKNAKPGTKEYCDALSAALEDADAINLGGSYSKDVAAQVASLEAQISKCMSDSNMGSSLGWYKEAKEEAAKDAKDDISMFTAFVKDVTAAEMAFNGDCDALKQKSIELMNKYASAMDAWDMLSDSMSDDEWEDFMISVFMSANLSENDIAKAAQKEEEIEKTCGGVSVFKDPCENMKCSGDTVCMDGQCVDLCDVISCPSGYACSAGMCVSTGNHQNPPADTCDPSTCNGDKECKNGKCVDKTGGNEPATGDCAKLANTGAAFKTLVKNVSTCEQLQKDEKAMISAMMKDNLSPDSGADEELFENCMIVWSMELASELGNKMDELEDKFEAATKNCDLEIFGDGDGFGDDDDDDMDF